MSGEQGAAGWYRQPERPEVERYFDGEKWTDAYRDPKTVPPSIPNGSNAFPIWKIVVGIIIAVMIINALLAAGGHNYLGK